MYRRSSRRDLTPGTRQLPKQIVFSSGTIISGADTDEAARVLQDSGCLVIENAFTSIIYAKMRKALAWTLQECMDEALGEESSSVCADELEKLLEISFDDGQPDYSYALSVEPGGIVSLKHTSSPITFQGSRQRQTLDFNPFNTCVEVVRNCMKPSLQRALIDVCYPQITGRLVPSESATVQCGELAKEFITPHRGLCQQDKQSMYQVFALVEDTSRKLFFLPGSHKTPTWSEADLKQAVAARSCTDTTWGTIVILKTGIVRFEGEAEPCKATESLHRLKSTSPSGAVSKHFRVDVSLCRETRDVRESDCLEWLSRVHNLAPPQQNIAPPRRVHPDDTCNRRSLVSRLSIGPRKQTNKRARMTRTG